MADKWFAKGQADAYSRVIMLSMIAMTPFVIVLAFATTPMMGAIAMGVAITIGGRGNMGVAVGVAVGIVTGITVGVAVDVDVDIAVGVVVGVVVGIGVAGGVPSGRVSISTPQSINCGLALTHP